MQKNKIKNRLFALGSVVSSFALMITALNVNTIDTGNALSSRLLLNMGGGASPFSKKDLVL